MRKRAAEASFEDLVAGYYGARRRPDAPEIEEVLENYYGRLRSVQPPRRSQAPVVTRSADDGEVLPQRQPDPTQEYVVAASTATTEYVVTPCRGAPAAAPLAAGGVPGGPGVPASTTREPAPALAPSPPIRQPTAGEEQTVDILRPFAEATSYGAPSPIPVPPATETGAPSRPARDPEDAKISEDDLVADLQAILSGQKVFDPATKQTVIPEKLAGAASRSDPRMPPRQDDGQAIFDRIAQSMEYANAYDVGPVELENRFADFDRMSELRARANERKPATSPPHGTVAAASPPPEERPVVRQMEVIEDLDRIQRHRQVSAPAAPPAASAPPRTPAPPLPPGEVTTVPDGPGACGPSALALSLGDRGDYSRPFYDTGEHVLAGGDLYPELRVGPPPGVTFSYGQLMSMGDFFERVDDLLAAPLEELRALKDLIHRSTTAHARGVTDPAHAVGNDDWNRVTNGRYMRLAETNYAHFSPRAVVEEGATGATRLSDNRATWEAHHRRAIEEAQRLFAARSDTSQPFLPEQALIINAFGDHFLTDAFASGHLINKEAMIGEFRRRFYTGAHVNEEGRAFFARVAERAFTGDVASRLSQLETVEPYRIKFLTVPWHPNINSASRFSALLIAAAEAEPEKVANFAVKALHDRLNHDGVEVTNQAGDGTWRLTGDEYLNQTSLGIVRKAVQQSVANINDRAIYESSVNYPVYFEKVWRFVPRPTPAARQALVRQIREYTDPASTVLSEASGAIIQGNLNVFISELIGRGRLRPA